MALKLTNEINRRVSDLPMIYGCDPFLHVCGDGDLMSLSFEGMNPFLDWLGWERSQECLIKRGFITYTRAAATAQAARSAGYLSDPCADANGIEYDTCDFTLTDFARLRRAGPTRDITKVGLDYCAQSPRYRLDGSPIRDQREYDMRVTVETLLQDLKLMIVEGNATTGGQFDGLEQLVKTGYTDSNGKVCELMDSIVIDWNGNDMDGGSGITWNGAAVGSTYSFIDVLLAAYRRVRHRIGMSPQLAAQSMQPGNMVLTLPHDFIQCVLDAFTCWSVCDDNISINSLDARNFRNSLNGGLYGAGRIYLDGFEVPIMPFDWGLISSVNLFDAYLLTGSVGAVKTFQGQYNDMAPVATIRPDRFATDAGMFLTWRDDDETCEQQIVEMQPRLLMPAPWAQVRFQDVSCDVPGGVMSADPWSEYFPYP